jgi:hypothetical protein
MTSACGQEITSAISRLKPRSVLAVCPDHRELEIALGESGDVRVYPVGGCDLRAQIAAIGRCDVALVARTLEHIEKQEGCALLAALRDVYSETCLVLVSVGSTAGVESGEIWTHHDLSALGFQLHARCGERETLYRFSLADYKATPDWLNSRNWANPRLWGKNRW